MTINLNNARRRSARLLALLGASSLALAACSSTGTAGEGDANSASNSSTSAESMDKVAVSASFYPIAWLAEKIGGDSVAVTSVTPANVEPHDFELAPADVDALSKSNLLLYVEGFQPSLDDAIANVSGPSVVNLADAVDLMAADPAAVDEHDHGAEGEEHADDHDHEAEGEEHADDHDHEAEGEEHAHEHDHGSLDPHFWLDPVRMKDAAVAVAAALSETAPDMKATFDANAKEIESQLDALNEKFTAGLEKCELSTFVTSHSAFSYLANRYNLKQTSISGVDPESEPSPAELAAVKEVVAETGTTTIFTEELVSPKTAEAVANETGAKTAVLSPIESQPEAGDYIAAMEANLANLQSALSCM